MNKFFDLRFVIGIFFGVVGLMLLIYGLVVYGKGHSGVNISCGIVFVVFSFVMIVLSLSGRKTDEFKRRAGEKSDNKQSPDRKWRTGFTGEKI